MLVYVDDILITSTNASQVNQVVKDLNKTFALKTLGSLNYFLGFEVYQDFSGLYLTQTKYVTDLFKKIAMNGAYSISTFMLFGNKLSLSQGELVEDHSLYHSTIGALQYLTMTRLDILFFVNKVSQFLHTLTIDHWKACKRFL